MERISETWEFTEDTLGQMLSYANIRSGQQVLVYDTGIVIGSLAQCMGGDGKVLSLLASTHHGSMCSVDSIYPLVRVIPSSGYSVKMYLLRSIQFLWTKRTLMPRIAIVSHGPVLFETSSRTYAPIPVNHEGY